MQEDAYMKMTGGDFKIDNREARRQKSNRRFRQPRPGHPDKFWEWKTTQRHPIDRLLDSPRRRKKKAKLERTAKNAGAQRKLTARTNNLRLKEARKLVAAATQEG